VAFGRDQRSGISVALGEEPRVQVSEQAKATLASFLEGRGEKEVLRLGAVKGSHTLALDKVRAGDLTFRHEGRPVLVVVAEIAQNLWGLGIDCRKVGTGLAIVLRRTTSGECGDVGTVGSGAPAMHRQSDEHRRLLGEVNEITVRVASLRLSRSTDKVARIRELEASKQAKWHEIRTLWAAAHNAHPESKPSWGSPPYGPSLLGTQKGEPHMLTITDDAKGLLREVLEQRGGPGQALRLSETAEGLGLSLDEAAEDDVIHDVDGRDVLLVQRDLATKMDSVTIEREDAPGGPRLVISK
jgi:Fe-S cluster assembly iron-binding protein IscA